MSLKTVPTTERDATIDILRGIAVFTMVAANLAGNILEQPHPLLFRLYGTFAAPMFIMLAGMMVAITARKRSHNLHYYLVRGGLVVLVGILVDLLIWQNYPIVSFDVLYLIGVSIPIAYLITIYLSYKLQLLLISAIFLLTPIVQILMGYVPNPIDWPITEHPPAELLVKPPDVIGHFFVDGWFPFFPWLGFALFGANLYALRELLGERFIPTIGHIGWILLLFGVVIWYLFPGDLFIRNGYSELFYPPTYGYILTALGIVLISYRQVDHHRDLIFLTPWRYLGQCALLAYILQYIFAHYLFAAFWPNSTFPVFVGFYGLLILILFVVAYVVRRFKNVHPHQPFLVRFLIGS